MFPPNESELGSGPGAHSQTSPVINFLCECKIVNEKNIVFFLKSGKWTIDFNWIIKFLGNLVSRMEENKFRRVKTE